MSADRFDLGRLLGQFGVPAPDISDAVESAVLGVCSRAGISGAEVRQRWGKVTVICDPAEAARAVRLKDRMLEAAQSEGAVTEVSVRVRPARSARW